MASKAAKSTALYERLSRDDELQGDSNSIKTQKKMLEDYARKNGFANLVHFTDDGWSGGSFERPSWKRLIAEVEAGNIGTVIVKDMSRVGRDYLQVGFYTEVFFREKDVRFLAIANSIDSQNRDSSEFAPFLNIMSEWYLRDTSRKIKAALHTKGMDGQRLTPIPLYGFNHDPEDRSKWVIDPEAAEVVRRIFQLTLDGIGPTKIARILADEKTERPTQHFASLGRAKSTNYNPTLPYAWSGNTVAKIIARPEYMGHTVNFRTTQESYKDKRYKENPPEDWVIFENTHPAIVNAEIWNLAQKCRKTVRRTDSLGEANPLTGLVLCADCGKRMYNHRMPNPKQYKHPNGKLYNRCPKDVYACSTNNLTARQHATGCSAHQIRTSVLRELVLETIRATCSRVKSDENAFIQQVRASSSIQREETAKAHARRIATEQKRVIELNVLIQKIYEDNVSGKLSDKRFEVLLSGYESEQTELERSLEALQSELDSFVEDSTRAEKFIEIVRRHTSFSELTTPMILEFVEKILVHEPDYSSGKRVQTVEIFLNFIGKCELPVTAPTPEETLAQDELAIKRERHREAQRRYEQRQRQIALAEKPAAAPTGTLPLAESVRVGQTLSLGSG